MSLTERYNDTLMRSATPACSRPSASSPPQSAEITLEDGRKVLNFCANNYLGLADHPTSSRRL